MNKKISGIFGAAFFLFLFILSLSTQGSFSVMGVQSRLGALLAKKLFLTPLILFQLKILTAYLILGFILAEIVYFFICYFPGTSRIKKRLSFFVFFFSLVSYIFSWSVHKYPALYAEALYDKMAWRRALQIFITDCLPGSTFFFVNVILFLIFTIALFNFLREEKRYRWILIFVLLLICSYKVRNLFLKNKNIGPNILILSADSLRADRFGNRNYFRKVTPHLDDLGEKGVNFLNCFVSLPRTFPCWISILTGEYSHTHGVRHMFPNRYRRDFTDESILTILKKKGYSTGVISDFAGDVFSRMNIGFDEVKAPYFNFITLLEQRSIEIHYFLFPYITNNFGRRIFPAMKELASFGDPFLLADEASASLDKLSKKDKFFLTIFFSTAHFPYASPYPYYKTFRSENYEGRFKYLKPNLIFESAGISESDISQVRSLYDGAVKSIDDACGEILQKLKRFGMDKNTIIIVLADHGENLYENDWGMGHGEHFRGDNVIRVPLIIYNPFKDYSNKKIEAMVREIDLAPTILEMLSVQPDRQFEGENLVPLMNGNEEKLHDYVFAETGIWFSNTGDDFYQKKRIMYPDITGLGEIDFNYNREVVLKDKYEDLINTAKARMIRSDSEKLIYYPTRKGIEFELYDLIKDETKDISAENPKRVEFLKEKLFSWMREGKGVVFKNGFSVTKDMD